MSNTNPKRTVWKPFLCGFLLGIFITIFLTISGIVIGAKTLKFWIAKKELVSLKTPRIQSSEGLDYSATAINMKGEKVSFNNFRNKPLFILAWHPECVHCLSTLITVQNLYDAIKDLNMSVLALTEGKKQDIEKVQKELNIDIPILMVKKEFLRSLCGDSIPCGLIVNPQGKIIYSHVGSANWCAPEIIQFFMNLVVN
ncbi:MAG: peroxiredoxin family protein [Candidatus Hydrogenedens sp.]